MFTIMTNGLVFSHHDTSAEAESAMAKARTEANEAAGRLISEALESQNFADSLSIVEGAPDVEEKPDPVAEVYASMARESFDSMIDALEAGARKPKARR